jgi:hypothetical protein
MAEVLYRHSSDAVPCALFPKVELKLEGESSNGLESSKIWSGCLTQLDKEEIQI